MDVDTVACNVCGIQKQETNHWLVVATSARVEFAGIAFLPAEACDVRRTGDGMRYEDVCGEGCALKRLSQWLAELKANSKPHEVKGHHDSRD